MSRSETPVSLSLPDPLEAYPVRGAERTRWIRSRRPERALGDPFKPHGFFVEEERTVSGRIAKTPTILLTNRECPWHCLMCDLWKTALPSSVPGGAIPAQIDQALSALEICPKSARAEQMQLKLYNGGSFFDPQAVPPADFNAIAERLAPFENVVVESHPALINDSSLRFRDQLCASSLDEKHPKLEVAMGLETAHPQVLEKLNKRMTLEQFAKACAFLVQNEIAVRAFVLVQPPFLPEAEALSWAERSVEFAVSVGASVVSLIPTRLGNGALETLRNTGHFAPPKLHTLEAAHDAGIRRGGARIFADTWNLREFASCDSCFAQRLDRIREMNFAQTILPNIECPGCKPGKALRS